MYSQNVWRRYLRTDEELSFRLRCRGATTCSGLYRVMGIAGHAPGEFSLASLGTKIAGQVTLMSPASIMLKAGRSLDRPAGISPVGFCVKLCVRKVAFDVSELETMFLYVGPVLQANNHRLCPSLTKLPSQME